MSEIYADYADYWIQACRKEELSEVAVFFEREWDSSHILAADKAFAEREFANARKGDYNLLLAREKEKGGLAGVLGYVPNYHYDNRLASPDIFLWITNWLAAAAYQGLGLRLLHALYIREKTKQAGTLGNNEKAGRIYKALKYQTGVLDHYYLVNPSIKNFKLFTGSTFEENTVSTCHEEEHTGLRLLSVGELTEPENSEAIRAYGRGAFPKKTLSYLIAKYGLNPYYHYDFYGIEKNGTITALLVIKKAGHEGAHMLRIVEYFGEPERLEGLGGAFLRLLAESGAEYLEFYCYGIERTLLEDCGFVLNQGDGAIVPAYFEPFVKENIVMNFAYNCPAGQKFRIYRGDCDREWPRFL